MSKWRNQGSNTLPGRGFLFLSFFFNYFIFFTFAPCLKTKREFNPDCCPVADGCFGLEKTVLSATPGAFLPGCSCSVLTGLLQNWPYARYSKLSPKCPSNLDSSMQVIMPRLGAEGSVVREGEGGGEGTH